MMLSIFFSGFAKKGGTVRSVESEKKNGRNQYMSKTDMELCFWLCWAQSREAGLFAKSQYQPSTVKLVVQELMPTSLDISKVYSPLSCISAA